MLKVKNSGSETRFLEAGFLTPRAFSPDKCDVIPILLHLCNSIRGGLFNILASSMDVGEPAPTKIVAKFLRIGIIMMRLRD